MHSKGKRQKTATKKYLLVRLVSNGISITSKDMTNLHFFQSVQKDCIQQAVTDYTYITVALGYRVTVYFPHISLEANSLKIHGNTTPRLFSTS